MSALHCLVIFFPTVRLHSLNDLSNSHICHLLNGECTACDWRRALTCSQYKTQFSSYFRPMRSFFLRDQKAFCELNFHRVLFRKRD